MRHDDDDDADLDDERPRRRRRQPPPSSGLPAWAWALIAAAVVLPALLAGLAFLLAFSRPASRDHDREADIAIVNYAPMTADELIDEWKVNPAGAARKYEESGVEVTGRLKLIDGWGDGESIIYLQGEKDQWDREVNVIVPKGPAKDGLLKCAVGKDVTVRARSNGTTNRNPWLRADSVFPK